jgi:hypothetical protein
VAAGEEGGSARVDRQIRKRNEVRAVYRKAVGFLPTLA